ncbi:MAG: PDZ domain-containing protein [Gemmatimonadetes bacterium]|nr:PDZ domain-containing protein [Gemmatimonadota bacterium]
MNTTRPKVLAIAALAFFGGVIFASSMDWTNLLVAQQGRVGSAPEVRMAPPGAAELQGGFAAVAEKVTPAVVSIQAARDPRPASRQNNNQNQRQQPRMQLPPGFEQFFGPDFDPGERGQAPQQASGTGFIVSKDGYILTNNHVVADMDRIRVLLTDKREFPARVIGRDPQTDVAVIKVDGANLPTVIIGNDVGTRVGEWVLAIGTPLGLDFTVTAGIVSAKGRSTQLNGLRQSLYAIMDFIQTDAAINPGNSGGPLVNTRGEVIGINSAIASPTGTYTGYGFAIPITLAKTVMDDIVAHGRVRRAVMGASMNEVTAEDAAVNKLSEIAGAKISDFGIRDNQQNLVAESPAEKAGVERGDIVVSANGKPVDRVSTLQRILRTHQPGDVVSLDIVRYGEKKNFKVKLVEAPADEPRAVASTARRDSEPNSAAATFSSLGITVEPITKDAIEQGVSDKLKGVLVTRVAPGSTGEGKLFPGDVIGEVRFPTRAPVTTVAELQRELGKLKAGQFVGLVVYSSGRDGATASRVVNLRLAQ